MELRGFTDHLYLLKKNYIFKKVYTDYGSDSCKIVLWAIKKPNKIKDGKVFYYHQSPQKIIQDYDIATDKDLESLYVVDKISKSKNVKFRPSIDSWLEIAHKTVYGYLEDDEKMHKIMLILKQIPKDKWETFLIRFIYGFNHSAYNEFLLNVLLNISEHISQDDIVSIDEHKPQLPKICQFYDKFRYKFTDRERLYLWENLISKEKQTIIESIDTHAIAHYLLEQFPETSDREELFFFFPLMKEKVLITNNIDNPFDFERDKTHKRYLFEFHNEQMTKNISNLDVSWSYATFKEIADAFLFYMSESYFTPQPHFISKPQDAIYSAIVYAENQDQLKMFQEILFNVLSCFFIDKEICPENKDEMLIKEHIQAVIIETIINKHLDNKNIEPDEETPFKL